MMRRIRFVLLIALSAALLASCGSKGPLVLPAQKPAQPDQPAPPDANKQQP